MIVATPNSAGSVKDAIVEVDATETSGVSEEPAEHEAAHSHEGSHSSGGHSHWGVVCRRSSNNFYSMGVSSDGRSYILKTKDGDTSPLAEGNPNDVVNRGEETNHIKGDCVGSKLTLYANGQQLLTAEDDDFGSGQVGLFVSNRGSVPQGAEVLFDNFLVSKP
jgi:hypothetical protein